MGLLETLYEGMRGVEDTAREWVKGFKSQEELYRALYEMKRITSRYAHLEMNFDARSPPGILYSKISGADVDLDTLWPGGDYNTIRDAMNTELNWVLLSKWKRTGFKEEAPTDRVFATMAPVVIWECFGAPYFVALWNAVHNDAPESAFMFVYSGGGAGVCSSEGEGFTAMHCVTYEEGVDATRCIIMDSSGGIGIFAPTVMSRSNDYAFGTITGLNIAPAPPLLTVPTERKAEIVCYGAPSSRVWSDTSTDIRWPWLSVLEGRYDRDTIDTIVTENTRWSWGNNYFCAVEGTMSTAEMTTARNGVFSHNATLSAGMSGAPIYCNGQLVGIHQSYCYTGAGPDCRHRKHKSLGLLLSFAERDRGAGPTAGYRDRARGL